MRTYTCLTLLVVLFCCDIQAQECPEKQYFDADEDLCKSLPTNFTLLFSATQYNIMIASENPLLPDTHLFDIVLYINNNTLTDTFPGDTVFFNIDHGLSFIFEGEGPSSDSSISDPAVFNTIGLSMVSSTTMDFNILYSTTVIARVVPELDIPAVSVNVSVNVTKFDSTYNCNGSECRNEGICQPVGSEFICKCTEGYLGVTCEYHVCDSCNSGNCSVDTNYTCECYPGFTDSNCSTNIDDCIAVSCGNGSCVDEVDGYSCDCNAGFAGDNCLLNIDDCDPDPCVNGTCSDLINTYTCDCYLDWEGKNCTSEIDLCKDPFGSNFPCDLIGYDKCIDGNNTFICECRSGYAGENCSIDIDECAGEPCQNNGTCEDLINSYECECKFGYDGKDCQTPIDFCLGQNESCGSGTCRSIEAIGYECDCDAGYSGDNCSIEIDECFTINPCENGATCIDQVANYSCLCPVGFTGVNCSQVIDNCDPDPCLHNSTCTSLIGSFRCDCSPDYIGARCEIEELFCNSATCLNGGTCSELDGGNGTMCSCLEGFSGNDCSDDLDFCMNASCKNGGTCLEGYGTKVYCKCPIDFGGDECEVEMIFCSENYCLNNGTCIDLDEGSSTVCICVEGFSGDMCDEDIEVCNVIPQKCFNGATCLDGYGVNYTCQCVDGFGGSDCSEDLNFCEDSFCLNGGICIEGIGAVKECNCTENFFGQRCETAFCPEEWCYNGGTCSIESNKTICSCKGECSGDRCEQDLSSPCEPDTCLNGGTCMMGICEDYICVCPSTYTGDNCETPLCQTDSCMNGGTCRVMNNELVCDCLEGFNGTSCEFDLNHCTFDECLNGGTCMEGLGVNVTCICPNCFIGNRCEVDMNYCQDFPDYCLNDGTCVDGVGCDYSCDCPDTYQGETCETAFCPDSWCSNGGTCSVESNKTVCSCESGCGGDRCETDEDVCIPNPCFNGGICTEGLCSDYTCNCTSEFEGDNCEIPLCQTDTCKNGGTCNVENNVLVCECQAAYSGQNCEIEIDSDCRSDSDCSSETFCNIECVSDSYTPHTALLSDAVTLKGLSFVNVEEAMHPDLSNEFSMIAVYNQEPQNRGYLIYYGTSAQKRNFGIFLDSLNSKIYLYYTNTTGQLRSYTIEQVELAGGYDHFLAVLFKNNLINVYLNGTSIGIQTLSNADFTHGVTASSPAKLFLGARYPRHYRFVGTIKQVIFFSTLQSQASIKQMQDEFYSLVDPFGNCVPYKQLDSSCPGPIEAPSTLCTSSKDRCSPSLRCLPNIIGNYTCQLQPPTCSSDLDCSGDYFCGSELPFNGSNYFDNSATEIPGETVFLQDSSMEFDGEDVVTLPTSDSPDLQSDITIFAVVYQESGNDGYVVGKGINGNMRDFGLYLRSSRKTVWLVYGADSHGLGYKEIVFFHNVSVADGNTHSIAAVVDSTANRTLLYIDGEVIGQQSPLPSEPTFRPGHNLLYVGGRPSTRYFRFKGTIRNLFVSSAPLQKDTIVKLHNDAMSGDQRISLQLPTSRYCLPYRKHTESCILGEESSDFRCLAPAVCIPECSSSVTRNIPSTNSAFQQTGVCVEPCTCDDETNEECGVDGSTYKNSCFRECLKVTKLHDGKCLIV